MFTGKKLMLSVASPQLAASAVVHKLRTARHRSGLVALLFIFLFLVSGIATLPNYGLTWDESLGNIFFGERYWHYFTSFNSKYLDFNTELEFHRQYTLNTFVAPFRDRPNEFPPLADTLSAATMYIFSYGLGWLNPVDGFHLFTILLCSVFLFVFYNFAAHRLGSFAAFTAIFCLGSFPRFWADMHFNVKDVPETVLFGFTIMAFWSWYEHPSWRRALLAGFLMGAALAVKANAIFIPVILLIGILPWSLRWQNWRESFTLFRKSLFHYLLMITSAAAFYLLSWPYLYADPFHRLKGYWSYILNQGGRTGLHWNIDPLRQVLTTLPEAMLLILGVGLISALRQVWKRDDRFDQMLLAWAIIPPLRASLPGAVNFDGIRHFLEFVPAIALLGGLGADRGARWLMSRMHTSQWVTQAGIIFVITVNLLFILYRFYPYQHIYYNLFTGGLAGARDRFLGSEATDYWAATYREGMDWLNLHAPPRSYVHALIADWVVTMSAPVLLRSDLQLVPVGKLPDFGEMKASPIPYYLMFITRDGGSSADEIDYTQKHGQLVFQVAVDHVPVMKVYQFGGK
jgi:hypothetical protein